MKSSGKTERKTSLWRGEESKLVEYTLKHTGSVHVVTQGTEAGNNARGMYLYAVHKTDYSER